MKMDAMLSFLSIFSLILVLESSSNFLSFLCFLVMRFKGICFSYQCIDYYCKLFNCFIREFRGFTVDCIVVCGNVFLFFVF